MFQLTSYLARGKEDFQVVASNGTMAVLSAGKDAMVNHLRGIMCDTMTLYYT